LSQGHLLFAVVTTVYMIVAIQLEEHDLKEFHGDAYIDYQATGPDVGAAAAQEVGAHRP